MTNFHNYIDAHQDELIASLQKCIQIPSVYTDDGSGHPYGQPLRDCLDYMLQLCRDMGFEAHEMDGHVGWCEYGQGEEMVGVLCHLDVVPAGEGWDYEPYAMTIVDDRAYGRGVTDDKGPAMCCVYAMRDILDSGISLKRRIRIIFGSCEETGDWEDMAWYREHEELPVFGITPDADFPAIYGEKGILSVDLAMPLVKSGLLDAAAGTAVNVVPPRCAVTYADEAGNPVTVRTEGKPAHGSTPEDGRNAISAAMEQLEAAGVKSPLVEFYQKRIGWDYNGVKMGCGFEDDKSGKLTLNAGVLKVRGGDLVLSLNIRNPVTFTKEAVLEAVTAAAAEYGMTVTLTEENAPVYMDRNGPVISALLEVYRAVTGDQVNEPTVIGGGTYARAMDNIVAFGPMLPGRELTEHMNNEYALVEDLYLCREIYRKALEKLAGEL